MNTPVEPKLDMDKLAKQLSLPKVSDKSFAPSSSQGIHEIVEAIEATLDLALTEFRTLKSRIKELDRLQNLFLNGHKP